MVSFVSAVWLTAFLFSSSVLYCDEYYPTDESSLALAITASNSNAGNDSIRFSQSIVLTAALPSIAKASGILTIHGHNRTLMRSAQSSVDFRILRIQSGNVVVENLTVSGGIAPPEGSSGTGGGVLNSGTLTLNNCSVLNNSSVGTGGGLTIANNNAHWGGGIAVRGGLVTIAGTLITGNLAWRDGGGLWIEDNVAEINGNPVHVEGQLTISNTTFSGNSADRGGGIVVNGGTLTLSQSTVYQNMAVSGRATGSANIGHGDHDGRTFCGVPESIRTLTNQSD